MPLRPEKGLREDEETKTAYEILVRPLRREDTVVVFNPETAKEYSRHIEVVRTELRRKRIYPHFFSLLRILKSKSRKVPAEEHSFEIAGEPIGRKDIHLLNSAKTGALTFGEKEALILTFAEDVYQVREAKNGMGVVMRIINMKNRDDVGYLQAV